MTDQTESEKQFSELIDCIEDARIALAKALDNHEVHPIVGAIALSALSHQAHIHMDEEDEEFVDKVTNMVIEAINEAEADEYSRFDKAIH